MARKAITEADWRANVTRQHLPTMEAALRTLRKSLDDTVVCDCEQGNADGITPRECGCEHREASRALEAGGCYIRRGLERGFTL